MSWRVLVFSMAFYLKLTIISLNFIIIHGYGWSGGNTQSYANTQKCPRHCHCQWRRKHHQNNLSKLEEGLRECTCEINPTTCSQSKEYCKRSRLWELTQIHQIKNCQEWNPYCSRQWVYSDCGSRSKNIIEIIRIIMIFLWTIFNPMGFLSFYEFIDWNLIKLIKI